MAQERGRALAGVVWSLRAGALAALGLAAAGFLFGFASGGLDVAEGLDWARKLLLVVGALCLVTGGCGLLVSGRDRPDAARPREDDTFRAFRLEVGLPWGAAVSVAAVSFLALGTLAEVLLVAFAG